MRGGEARGREAAEHDRMDRADARRRPASRTAPPGTIGMYSSTRSPRADAFGEQHRGDAVDLVEQLAIRVDALGCRSRSRRRSARPGRRASRDADRPRCGRRWWCRRRTIAAAVRAVVEDAIERSLPFDRGCLVAPEAVGILDAASMEVVIAGHQASLRPIVVTGGTTRPASRRWTHTAGTRRRVTFHSGSATARSGGAIAFHRLQRSAVLLF